MKKRDLKDIEANICVGFNKILKCRLKDKSADFFLYGGNSIQAMKLVNYLNQIYGYEITVEAIFKNPSIHELAVYIAEHLSEEKNCLESLHSMKNATQKLGIYILTQQEHTGISYNMPVCYEVQGKINFKQLKKSYQKIQEEFDIFRTIFFLKNDELREEVLDKPIIEIHEFTTKGENIEDIFRKFVIPFSLNKLPLTRMGVWENNDKTYIFIDFHHIISDGISLEIFLGLLSEYYKNENFNQFLNVPKKNVHIKKNLKCQKKYWLSVFNEIDSKTEIIGDYPRKARRSYGGDTIYSTISKNIQLKVREMAKSYSCTEFMIYLSAYMILVSKYAMKQSVIVGIPVAGRTSSDSQNALGMFVNSLAIRGCINNDEAYISFLKDIKKQLIDAYANQDYPFYQLVSDLGLSGEISENPLFNIFFIYQNYGHDTYTLDDKEMKEIRGLDKVSKFDLTLEIYPDHDTTFISLEYSTDLYKANTVEAILAHYLELLNNLIDSPEKRISEIKYVTKYEEEKINKEFNSTNYYEYPTAHFADLFEKKVAQIPEHIAVIFNAEKISYNDLNRYGNAVANLLKKKIQEEEYIVPFISARGIEMIVGIIGINKANFAFLNLDYTLPIERIKFMLNECGSKIILVGKINEKIEDVLRELDVEFVKLSDIKNFTENLKFARKSNVLSYIMYTSGTTGKPKGVMIENLGLIAYSLYIGERYGFTHNTAVLQSTTYTFDPFIVETMPALLFGSKIVITDDDMVLDRERLIRYMNEQAVNIVDFCPTVLSRLADYLGQVKTLSIVMSGGEVLPNDLKNKILKEGIRLYNHYGPTEITVDATIQECKLGESVTLGTPLPFKKVMIVNNNSIAGINVPGEIYIGGVGIARGYLNKNDISSEVFFEDQNGNRYYKTGDLGKWSENGEIIYLGRQDTQIKILGHRIELSEIEESIRRIEYIVDVVVACDQDNLIAYYVGERFLNDSYLQGALKKELPFYMIPSFWVKIDEIPYTINGKVDLKKLPKLSVNLKEVNKRPLTELEVQVTKIFSDILRNTKIDKYDNFFKRGGNSLKAAFLLNRIKKEVGFHITLNDFFENPTIDGICDILLKVDESLKKVKEETIDDVYKNKIVASPQQKRLFVIQINNPEFTGYNMTRCLLFEKRIDIKRMTNVLNEIIRKNDILHTNFILEENEIYQKVEEVIQVNIIVKEVESVIISEALSSFVRPFDLSKDQLMRVGIIHTRQCDYFMLDIHHIISDGISIEMLLEDIIEGYCLNRPINIRKQYRDYSVWISKKNNNKEKLFWKEKLSNIYERTEIIKDFSDNQNNLHKGRILTWNLSYKLSQDIKDFCIVNKCSEYAYFMTALLILINRYCMNDNIIIASPFSGRTEARYENVLGFFVNTLLFTEKVSEDEAFMELLYRVQNSIWSMQDNQNYPYEKICSFLGLEKGKAGGDVTDILFVLQNMDGLSKLPEYVHEVEISLEPEMDYKITFEIQEDECYRIFLTYATDLYTRVNMEYFLRHYFNILQNILVNYDKKIRHINEQDEAESKIAILKGKYIDLPYSSVKEIFKDISKNWGDRVAIFDSYRSLTYQELDSLSNKLASFLYEKGLKRGDKLIIYGEKCIESIISILTCFKMGIIYIPIDIEWPLMRINYITNCAVIKYILVVKSDNDIVKIKFNNNSRVMSYPYIDIEKYKDYNLDTDISIYDPAYIIFTSGTTGNPKGVQVNQEGIINLWQQNKLVKGITPRDKVLQFSSLSFDALISELTMSIFCGASLAIVEEQYRRNFSEISNFILKRGITIGVFPPHIVRNIPIKSMRCIITAGEEIGAAEYDKIISSGCEYWNEYGPTEGTVCSTMWNSKGKRSGDKIPIGVPICNVNISIIKEEKVLGIGMVGEIYIEGKNIADGYLVGDKVGISFQKNNCRGYFTGDMGRICSDGNVEFLGRKDKQVKVNGFRIELGEIENVLKKEESINEAVAFVRNNGGNKEIILVFVTENNIDLKKIRYKLSNKLPLYMMPSKIQKVDNIPLNSNGKVDISKLESILVPEGNNESNQVSAEETEVLKLVREILHRKDISENDNFFSVGGTSIEAAFLLDKIKKAFRKRISYYDLAICETIQDISNIVNRKEIEENEQNSSEKCLMTNSEKQIYLASLVDEKCTYNMPHSYRIKNEIDIDKLKKAFVQIVTENNNLHSLFFEENGEFYKKVLIDYNIDFKYQESDVKLSNDQIKKLIQPFHFCDEALIRMQVIREPASYLIFMDAHHIIFDKTTWDSFFAMLQKYYKGE